MTTQLSIPSTALSVKETQPFMALCFTTRATLRTLSQHAPGVAENLYREAANLGLEGTGPIQWIYTGVNGKEANEFQVEIVLPISRQGESSGQFAYNVFQPFQCVSYTYTGPWSDFAAVYDILFRQFRQNNYQYNGQVREIYSTVDFANPANCVTEMQIGMD